MEKLDAGTFLTKTHNLSKVDVRSPSEYEKGHIPGAVNLPLFSDFERSEVGTLYKQTGREPAIELGLKIVGPKMAMLAAKAKSVASEDQIGVYCWRGGMRSQSMAWLFDLIGIETLVLKGGYKAYRHQVMADFSNIPHLIILRGLTGSGKTAILRALQKMGEQVIDLEKLAAHRGSVFGGIGLGKQPTTAQFQNDTHQAMSKLNQDKRIWVENESLRIGDIYLAEAFWQNMNNADVLEINVDKKSRAQRLVEEYGQFNSGDLAAAVQRIEKRLGRNQAKEVLGLLDQGKLYETALLLLDYYDKTYLNSRSKYKSRILARIDAASGDPDTNAKLLIAKANELKL